MESKDHPMYRQLVEHFRLFLTEQIAELERDPDIIEAGLSRLDIVSIIQNDALQTAALNIPRLSQGVVSVSDYLRLRTDAFTEAARLVAVGGTN